MSPVEVGLIALVILFLLMFMGMHLGFAMALVGFAGYVFIAGLDQAVIMVGLVPYTTVASYIFGVMPVFLLMAEFASASGLVHDGYRTMHTWLGHLRGGLAMASMGGCTAFAACTGGSLENAAVMTRISLPEMLEYKYDPALATGCIAAGGTLAFLIPPSMAFIIYGMIAEQSIGRLFIAGIFPGILLSLMFIATIYIIVKRNPKAGPPGRRASWRERLVSVKDVWGILILFLIVMGGIWGGIFTPTEAGAIGAFIAFVLALAKKRLTWQNVVYSVIESLKTVGMVFGMMIGAMIFGYFTAVAGLPMELANFVAGLHIPPVAVLAAALLLYCILGCIMDGLAMHLLTLPILVPLLSAIGIDLIWFGVLSTLTAEMALITPPIGMNVFVIAGMVKDRGIEMYTVFRGVLPFALTIAVCMVILVAFPQISLFLPNTMMAKT